VKVLVTHPGRQHSHQAALGLARSGMLAGYWSGVPAVVEQAERVPAWLRRRFARYAPIELDPRLARWFPATPALRRLSDELLPPAGAARIDFAACRLFDRWAAAGLRAWRVMAAGRAGTAGTAGAAGGATPPSAVVACEISALSTFRAARRLGITTFLDAPSLHHRAQDRLHGTADPERLHARIIGIKDQEIALADHVLTVSDLARDTYLEAGVPAGRVHALTLGADLELFTPGRGREERDGGGFIFLFCGAMIRRKGFDLLLDAFDRVAGELPETRLRVVGPRGGDAAACLDARKGNPRITETGPVTQGKLAGELRRADCLVLPSRNDSYGMVVAEALACGLPVLVSEMVGAKELVAPGRNGFIVPVGDGHGDNAALAERMAWCVRNREAVAGMSEECRKSVEAATWPAYHHRLAELLRTILRERAAA
jgi:glycosyltransferase involved in cell wall biosynthesis